MLYLPPFVLRARIVLPAIAVAGLALDSPISLSGRVSAAVTGSGAVAADQSIGGGASVSVTQAGTLTLDRAISGAATATVTATGSVVDGVPISGAASTTVTATGAVVLDQIIDGATSATIAAIGAVMIDQPIDGAASATITGTGGVTPPGGISGATSVTITATGAVVLDQIIDGAASTTVTATGNVIAGNKSVVSFANMNSGYDYSSEGPDAKIPVWIARYSGEAGHTFAANANFGNPESYVYPPGSTFGDAEVVSAGYDGGDSGAFVAAGFDYHSYTASNFRSSETPTTGQADYDGILSQIDAVEAVYPATRHRVHVFWQEYSAFMDPAPFPGSAQNFTDWKAALDGAYGVWAIALVDNLRAARPALDIEIVDCTNLFVEILDNELSDFVVADILIDGDGHGTAATYALASLIFYRSMYGESAPASYTFPVSVDARVQANFSAILARIENWVAPGVGISGATSTTVTATGAVVLDQIIDGAASATITAAGAADLDQPIVGATSTTVTATGAVFTSAGISGAASTTVTSTGAVVLDQSIDGAASTTVTATGDVTLAAGASPPPAVTFSGAGNHMTGFGLGAAVTEFTYVFQGVGAYPSTGQIINAADPFSMFFNADDRLAWYVEAVSDVNFGFEDMPNAAGNDVTIMVAISGSGALPGGRTFQIHVDGVEVAFGSGTVTPVNMAGLYLFVGEGGGGLPWAIDAYRVWLSQTAALDGGDSAIWDAFATATHGPVGLAAPGTVGGVTPDRFVEGPAATWNLSPYMVGAVVDA